MIDWHGLVPTESELASDPTSRARAGPGEEGGGSAMGEDEQAREALWLHEGERPKEQSSDPTSFDLTQHFVYKVLCCCCKFVFC